MVASDIHKCDVPLWFAVPHTERGARGHLCAASLYVLIYLSATFAIV